MHAVAGRCGRPGRWGDLCSRSCGAAAMLRSGVPSPPQLSPLWEHWARRGEWSGEGRGDAEAGREWALACCGVVGVEAMWSAWRKVELAGDTTSRTQTEDRQKRPRASRTQRKLKCVGGSSRVRRRCAARDRAIARNFCLREVPMWAGAAGRARGGVDPSRAGDAANSSTLLVKGCWSVWQTGTPSLRMYSVVKTTSRRGCV